MIFPLTLATFRFSGFTSTCTSSAEAAAVVVVVVFLENSTDTLPISGTSTVVGPYRLTVTGLPRTLSLAGATTSAVGCPSTGQVASALIASRPSSAVAGRPGACTSALTSLTEAAVPLASARVTDLPMSALTRVTGPVWSTPATVAVSTEPSLCSGVSTLLSAMFTGTSTALFNSLTSRASSAVTARAFPGEGEGGVDGAAWTGPAVSAVLATTTAAAETIRREDERADAPEDGRADRREDKAVPPHR